ncbi:MAG TPA: OB-fold nucleic acid binding domain-containing protein, partial [Anaerolineaceae bacterium]|nr:OB-fold nucleic acid binding domain-containing protein [Anaerolineaceae bacterium]
MELSDLEKIRLAKLQRMEAEGIPPFPTRAHLTHTTRQAIEAFEAAEAGSNTPVEATLGGRIRSLRHMGKLSFAHIEDSTGRVQLFFRINEVGEELLARLREDFDLGDFVEASGVMLRTRTGEVSLQVHSFRMLAKAITPLPAAKDEVVNGEVVRHAALTDPETRYRQRYADLAVNPEVREIFRTRAAVIAALRQFLDEFAGETGAVVGDQRAADLDDKATRLANFPSHRLAPRLARRPPPRPF